MARKARRIPLIYVLSIFTCSAAWGFGSEGHETTAAIAAQFLTGSNAEKEIKKILRPGEDLAWAARWADCAKGYRYCGKPLTGEMKAFVAKNRNHHRYHFADIPFEISKYDSNAVGASQEDVVHILVQAIAVLQGKSDLTNNPHRFTTREAFFLVCHLTGDIHQPLHVGAAYIDPHNQFVKPASQYDVDSGKAAKTKGGNWLMLGSQNLHDNWDTLYIQRAMKRHGAISPQEFAIALTVKGMPVPRDAGDPITWPERWATESVMLAKTEMEGISIDALTKVDSGGSTHPQWAITPPLNYSAKVVTMSEQQLWLAGARLAQIFKAIWP